MKNAYVFCQGTGKEDTEMNSYAQDKDKIAEFDLQRSIEEVRAYEHPNLRHLSSRRLDLSPELLKAVKLEPNTGYDIFQNETLKI